MEKELRPRRTCALKQIEKTRKEIAREELNRIQNVEDNNAVGDFEFDDSDDDFIDSRPKAENLDKGKSGKEMFGFDSRSPSVKMNLLKKAAKTPTRKSMKQPSTPSTRGTPSKRASQLREREPATPHTTRKRIAKKLEKFREEQINGRDESDDSDESDAGDDDFIEDGLLDEDEIPTDDAAGYFTQNNRQSKIKTTDHTLSKLGASMLSEEQIDEILSEQKDPHSKHRKKVLSRLVESFPFWRLLALEGSNLLLYGLGSKIELLRRFSDYVFDDNFITMTINGFLPTFCLQEMVSNILDQVIESRPKGVIGIQPQLDFIANHFSEDNAPHLFILVNSIDAAPMTNPKTLQAFETLAAAPMIHIIGSVNHINAPLLWDLNRARSMKWAWLDATTYEPYRMELCSDSLKSSTANTLSSLEHVFASLTSNAKKVFMIIATHTLERSSTPGFKGMAFQDCYRLCREAFIVNSDLTLRTQLTEFVDHDMIRIRKGQDGVEYLVIPLQRDTLQIFIQQQDDS